MLELMDKHGFTVRDIAEMYDGLTWQKVARTVGKLRNPEGKQDKNKQKKQASEPEQGLEPEVAAELTEAALPVAVAPVPKKLKPTSFAGKLLFYEIHENAIVISNGERKMIIPKDSLPDFIDELTELKDQVV